MTKQNAEKTDYSRDFSKLKVHNSANNHQTGTNFELDLQLVIIKLHAIYRIDILKNEEKM